MLFVLFFFRFLSASHSHSAYSFRPKPHVFPLSIIHYHIFLLHRLLPFLLRHICCPISIFPVISWNSNVDCHVHKNLPLLCILCQMNRIHILVSYLFEINCNIIYPFMYIYIYICMYIFTYKCVCVCRSPKVLWQFYVHVSSVPCF